MASKRMRGGYSAKPAVGKMPMPAMKPMMKMSADMERMAKRMRGIARRGKR